MRKTNKHWRTKTTATETAKKKNDKQILSLRYLDDASIFPFSGAVAAISRLPILRIK